MAVSPADLKRLLDQAGLDYVEGPEETLLFRLDVGNEQLNMVIDRPSEGRIVQFRTLKMLMAPEVAYRRMLLSALATSNDKLKLVKFALDPEDGEVCTYIDIVVGDGGLTKKQFLRCIHALQHLVIRAIDRFRKIIATGVDPGLSTDIAPEAMQSMIDRMLEGGAKNAKKGNGGNGHGGNGHGGGGHSTKMEERKN